MNCLLVKKLGIISDTHGLIREEVYKLFDGCDLILHAGDIVKEETIQRLEEICEVIAVRGNNDYMLPLNKYPNFREFVINDNVKVFMIHDINQMHQDINNYDLVIHGHTHRFSEKYNNKTLILNPGSFGPLRFSFPITLAVIEFDECNNMELKFYEI